MLKSSGLKIPGRGPKHCSPVGRTAPAGPVGPAGPKDGAPPKASTPPKASEEGDEVPGDFALGEQVWVNGVKPGAVAYLGETQFAPGQWAGVVLTEPLGKNDGSVGGVRYFQCQPLQGIFTRPSKLSRQPAGEGSDGHSTDSTQNQNQRAAVPLREGLLNSTVKTGNESGSNMSDSGSVKKGGDKDLRVGDRVLVGGSKMGVIRYMGETDFAKGEWCGVELDEPLGKNDGAVAGTRYFQCLQKFGLFAPIHKVIRIGFPSTSPAKTKKSKRVAMGVSSLAHSPSSSSISSVSSVASSVGGRPSRAGLLTETSSRYARKISGTTALQEALKEKQQHIEQLLAERDLERAEVAKATSHIRQVETELDALRTQHVQFVTDSEGNLQQVKVQLAAIQKDKLELTNQLEEEKRKVEDLQFRVEEESISKGDLEGRFSPRAASSRWANRTKQTTVEEQSRIVQLEEELALRREEVRELRVQLRGADGGEQRVEQEVQEAGQRAVEELKEQNNKQNQEIGQLKQRLQQATKENMDMMDTWKDKFDSLVTDHQRSLEELKTSLSEGASFSPGAPGQDVQELRAALESLKMEHQLEAENLKAKHSIQTAVGSKEREELGRRLQEAEERLAAEERRAEELLVRLELSERRNREEAQQHGREEVRELQEQLKVTANRLQAAQAHRYSPHDADVIDNDQISDETMKLKQNVEETMEKLLKREKEVSTLTSQVEALKSQIGALETKLHLSENRAEVLTRDKTRLETELEAMTKKSHDASGQLVSISQELLKKERSLNELRVLLLESHRHSRDLDKDVNRERNKAEWRVKEQKLQDDIQSLRHKLLLLGKERSSPDHRRYSLLEPSVLDSEVTRLRQRLLSTEDALRNALEHNQQVDQLVQAMRKNPDKTPVHAANSSNGIHQQESHSFPDEQH